jgi:Pentapeptide repeats (8 copies)
MIIRERRERPAPWQEQRHKATHKWMLPFVGLECFWEWVAYGLSNWIFLEVLEYLGSFSVLIAVIFYFSESGNRIKQKHYQAWQVINTAQGKGGSGGRIDALQELNADKVSLDGVDVTSAALQGIQLRDAKLHRANFSSTDLRNSDFTGSNFSLADLNSANLRNTVLDHAIFLQADLQNSDLNSSSLVGANLGGATLDDADLRDADLRDIQWQHLKSIKAANIANVRNAPPGFVAWALKNGAVDQADADE